MRELCSQFTVICEQKESFRVIVQSSDGKKSDREITEMIHDCFPAAVIADSCHFPHWLVIKNISLFSFRLYYFIPYTDDIIFVDLKTHLCNDLPVYLDQAIRYHLFSMSPAGYPAEG